MFHIWSCANNTCLEEFIVCVNKQMHLIVDATIIIISLFTEPAVTTDVLLTNQRYTKIAN